VELTVPGNSLSEATLTDKGAGNFDESKAEESFPLEGTLDERTDENTNEVSVADDVVKGTYVDGPVATTSKLLASVRDEPSQTFSVELADANISALSHTSDESAV